MSWWTKLRDKVFDDALGIDETRGGIGGAIADAVEDTNEFLKDTEDYIVDDVGIEWETLAAAGLMFIPGMQGYAASALQGGLNAIGLGGIGSTTLGGAFGGGLTAAEAVTRGLVMGTRLGTATSALGQGLTQGFDNIDFNLAAKQGLTSGVYSAAIYPAMDVLGYGLQQGMENLNQIATNNPNAYGSSLLGEISNPELYEVGGQIRDGLFSVQQSMGLQMGMTGEIDPLNTAAAFIGGATLGTGGTFTTPTMQLGYLSGGAAMNDEGGMGTEMAGSADYNISGAADSNPLSICGGGRGDTSQSGSSVPEAQFIDIGSGQFGNSGLGGVFGGFDELGGSNVMVDTDKLIDQYAQQGLGAMVTARAS